MGERKKEVKGHDIGRLGFGHLGYRLSFGIFFGN